MSCRSIGYALVGLGLLAAGCSSKSTPITDGGTTLDAPSEAAVDGGKLSSISCYSSVQFFCEERQAPTAAQADALRVMCSSGSGELEEPSDCPPAGFLGKCTISSGELAGQIRRYYTGADAVYQQDFCVNTAQGVWSTTF